MNFQIIKRDKYHWDIYNNAGRLYKIRGDSETITLTKDFDDILIRFPSVESCMAYICAALMKE